MGDLIEIRATAAEELNRWIYCHHCKTMGEMGVIGRMPTGGVAFRCRLCMRTVEIAKRRQEN